MLYIKKEVKDYNKNIWNIIISKFATFTGQWSPQSISRHIIEFQKFPIFKSPCIIDGYAYYGGWEVIF